MGMALPISIRRPNVAIWNPTWKVYNSLGDLLSWYHHSLINSLIFCPHFGYHTLYDVFMTLSLIVVSNLALFPFLSIIIGS